VTSVDTLVRIPFFGAVGSLEQQSELQESLASDALASYMSLVALQMLAIRPLVTLNFIVAPHLNTERWWFPSFHSRRRLT